MTWTLSHIEALAPDQPALAAAGKLLTPSAWPLLARDADASIVWGEAQGSGSAPYRLSFTPADQGYKCSCPSRKFPCKHVLALMWQFAEHPARFQPGDPPPWVTDWLARRKPGGRVGARDVATDRPRAEAQADDPEQKPDDPQAVARRQKALAAREAGMAEALDALDTWLGDQLREGLATFPQRAAASCRAAAQRLVDGKAGGLALLLDQLPPTLFGLPEALRADFILGELARLHLIARAYRRQDALPEALRADVRRTVGWSQNRAELLADPAAPRRRAAWTVAGSRAVVQPDRLRRLETWLAAPDGAAALLLDYVPLQGGAAGPPFAAGERFEAELVFYPSPAPLRAMVAQRGPSAAERGGPPPGPSLTQALAARQARLAALPWLDDDLLVATGAHVADIAGTLYLADGEVALPLVARQAEIAAPLSGMALPSAAAVWDGRRLTLLAAQTPLGPWFDA